jgi:hypothetical protein
MDLVYVYPIRKIISGTNLSGKLRIQQNSVRNQIKPGSIPVGQYTRDTFRTATSL